MCGSYSRTTYHLPPTLCTVYHYLVLVPVVRHGLIFYLLPSWGVPVYLFSSSAVHVRRSVGGGNEIQCVCNPQKQQHDGVPLLLRPVSEEPLLYVELLGGEEEEEEEERKYPSLKQTNKLTNKLTTASSEEEGHCLLLLPFCLPYNK
jgi:hypothetical protein